MAGDAPGPRRVVAMAGHRRDDPAAGAAVARPALDDPDPAVRATALGALARLEDLRFDELERAGRDEAPAVRCRVAELAWRFGPAGCRLLLGLAADPRPAVVEAACFGLGELGPPAGPDAVAALAGVARDHADPLCREAAVAAIGAIGLAGPDQAGLRAVLDATGDKPAIRRRAVLALAPFEGTEVEAALERALTDRDWQVRQAAEDLTGRRPTS